MGKRLANNPITDLRNNREFLDSAYLNNATFNMYMQIFKLVRDVQLINQSDEDDIY